jgi:hypothetical protein
MLATFSGVALTRFFVTRLGRMFLRSRNKQSLLEEKIEEYKAFLRDFQGLRESEYVVQIGGIATIDRRLIMIDALITTAQAQLQLYYNTSTLANYLYAIFITVRHNRLTTDPQVLAIEAEYQRRGGTGLNQTHSVLFFTAGSLYEHISAKELSANCRKHMGVDTH